MEFAGRLRGSDEALSAEGVTLRLGETRLEGRASGSFREDERPSLRATIESPHVRLADIGLAPDEDVPSSEEEEAPALPPFEELRAIDLDLELRADRITGRAGLDDLRDAHATVRLHDGELLLGDVGAVYELGHVGGELRVDASTPEPHLAVELEAEAIDLGRVMSQVESDTDFSGLVDLHVSLRSEGRTPEEILVALEGDTRLVLRDGTTATTYARMFVVNLAHVAFPLLRPRRDTQIGCAVMAFELESGVARVATLVLDGGEITVTGSGEIDLVRGVYDLELVPSTTNPGVMSMAPRVQVVGPLGQPQFRPVKRTLASSMGRGLLANVRKAGGRLLRPLRSRDDTLESAEITCADVGR